MDLNICLPIAAYFLGAVPFGLLIAKAVSGVDVRAHGSGNIGASNVSRVSGRLWGRVTLLLDAAKGALAAGLGFLWGGPELASSAGLAAVVGHCWSVYLGFRGGKGVATTAGVLAVLTPFLMLWGVLVWVSVRWKTRISSLASLWACLAVVSATALLRVEFLAVVAASVGIVVFRHRENLVRLRLGEEPFTKL